MKNAREQWDTAELHALGSLPDGPISEDAAKTVLLGVVVPILSGVAAML